MKALILINNAPNFRPFFQLLGTELEKYNCDCFYALDSHLTDYLFPNIKLTPTENVYYFSDYWQTHQEKTLRPGYEDINIWQAFYPDFDRMFLYQVGLHNSKAYYHNLVVALINFFDDLISKLNIDVVIHENIANVFSYAAFYAAKKNNKKYFGITASRIPNRIEIMSHYLADSGHLRKIYDACGQGLLPTDPAEEEYITSYLAKVHIIEPDYMHTNRKEFKLGFFRKYFCKEKLKKALALGRFYLKHRKQLNYNYTANQPFKLSFYQMINYLIEKARTKYAKKYFSSASKEDTYYLYPLHTHPESSTSVWARHYVDEVAVIANIAQNLPFGTFLYVKEHPLGMGQFTMRDYKYLSKLPNVKLISGTQKNSKQLVSHSQGVICLANTVGFEALLLGKPVIAFGDSFYEQLPGCYKLHNFNELFPLVQQLQKNPVNINTHDILRAYYRFTYPVKLNYSENPNNCSGYQEIAKLIIGT